MYLLISLIVLGISITLFKRAAGSLAINELNMISFVFYTLFFWTFIGSLIVIYDLHYTHSKIPMNKSVHIWGWIGIMYCMIAVPIGMLIVSSFYKIKSMKKLNLAYQASPLKSFFIDGDKNFRYSLYIFSFLSIAIVIYGIVSLSGIPIINMLTSNDSYSLLKDQRNTTRLFSNDNFILQIYLPMQAAFTPIFAYVAFAYWRAYKNNKDLWWFVIMSLVSTILLTFDLNKGRILYFIIGLVFIFILMKNKKIKIKIKYFFTWIFLGVLMIGVLYIYFLGVYTENLDIISILKISIQGITGRVFVGQISGWYNGLIVFPDQYPFLFFSSTGKLIHEILGLPFQSDYGIILRFMTDSNAKMFGSGHFTTFFLGEAWANFGLIGVIIAPPIVGAVIQRFNIFFLNARKTPIHLAMYTTLTLSFPVLNGFIGFYYPAWLIQYLLMLIIIYLVALFLKK